MIYRPKIRRANAKQLLGIGYRRFTEVTVWVKVIILVGTDPKEPAYFFFHAG